MIWLLKLISGKTDACLDDKCWPARWTCTRRSSLDYSVYETVLFEFVCRDMLRFSAVCLCWLWRNRVISWHLFCRLEHRDWRETPIAHVVCSRHDLHNKPFNYCKIYLLFAHIFFKKVYFCFYLQSSVRNITNIINVIDIVVLQYRNWTVLWLWMCRSSRRCRNSDVCQRRLCHLGLVTLITLVVSF